RSLSLHFHRSPTLPAPPSFPTRRSSDLHPVLDDPSLPAAREDVTRLVLCSGKLYYELIAHESRETLDQVAIGRVELLYPFAENEDRKSTRLNSSHVAISYAVFCLKKKKT